MKPEFLAALAQRRTQYALGRNVPHSRTDLTQLIQHAIRQCPSAFNSQSSRAVILFGEQSDVFWSFVKDALRAIVPAEDFAASEARVNGFAAGVGTVLFYEDQNVVTHMQREFPLYADNFPVWSEHSSGIAQFAVWTALATINVGASLQHYNPLPDAAVAAHWNIPASWKLRAQLPFGSHAAPIADKTYMDDAARFRVFE